MRDNESEKFIPGCLENRLVLDLMSSCLSGGGCDEK
jgi:hypothetical protein